MYARTSRLMRAPRGWDKFIYFSSSHKNGRCWHPEGLLTRQYCVPSLCDANKQFIYTRARLAGWLCCADGCRAAGVSVGEGRVPVVVGDWRPRLRHNGVDSWVVFLLTYLEPSARLGRESETGGMWNRCSKQAHSSPRGITYTAYTPGRRSRWQYTPGRILDLKHLISSEMAQKKRTESEIIKKVYAWRVYKHGMVMAPERGTNPGKNFSTRVDKFPVLTTPFSMILLLPLLFKSITFSPHLRTGGHF